MTRHYLTPKNPAHVDTIVVGYDRPLRTFFAQAYKNHEDDEPTFLLWVGFGHGEFPYAQPIIELAGEYAHIPEDLFDALDDDRACAAIQTMQQANAVTRWTEHGRAETVPAT